MKSRNVICILFVAVALAGAFAHAAENAADQAPVPTQNLPEGFKLLAVKTASTPGVNMTDEIADFYGAKDIGPASATIGIYIWAPLGQGYDSKITLLSLQDSDHARAAASNYLSNFQSENAVKLPGNVSLVNPETINNHEVLEITDIIRNSEIRYLYLWNNGSTVILAEGNGNRNMSIELASATGL